MAEFVVYNSAGKILRTGSCEAHMVEHQAREGEFVLSYADFSISDQIHFIDLSGDEPTIALKPDDIDPVEARNSCLRSLKSAFQVKVQLGFAWGGKVFQIDEASQQRIQAVEALARRALEGEEWPTGFAFTALDNTRLPMTPEEARDFAYAAGVYVYRLRDHYWSIRDLVKDPETPVSAAIAAITDITWPV